MEKTMGQNTKLLTEILPLLVFFGVYKISNLIIATAALIGATLVTMLIVYYFEKKISKMPLISAIILALFGGLTIFSENEIFIKLKPTILNLLFAAILFIGYLRGKGYLKYLMGEAIKMEESAWRIFSFRWALFFVFLAILNEIIWRNFTEEFWVSFKVFGMLPISLTFMISQIPFLKNNIKNNLK